MSDPCELPDGDHPDRAHPDPASLAGFADLALRDLTRRLEAKVTRGDATLADYGTLARCHTEWVRRAPARGWAVELKRG